MGDENNVDVGWELSKENFQPLRKGRDPKRMERGNE